MTARAVGTPGPGTGRLGAVSIAIGAAALAVCAIGGLSAAPQFFRSYLIAYLFWLGIALGSLAILMLHHLVGGMWGHLIRRPLESATRTLWIMALLFLPLAFGLRALYPWARPGGLDAEMLHHKAIYLNAPFFMGRAALYLALWILLAFLLNRWSAAQDGAGDGHAIGNRMRHLSGPGLVIYVLTVTFAGFDWLMSLEPEWWSTIFGMTVIVGQGLSGIAFMVIVARALSRDGRFARVARPVNFHDLGNLMLMFVMLWAYLAFSQFLIIWSGNLAEEIGWYIPRVQTSWAIIAVVLIVFHFFVPFLLLLSRRTKRSMSMLTGVAVTLLVMRLFDLVWTVQPSFRHDGLAIHWMDLLAPVGIGGIWFAAFLWQLGRMPLVARHEPAEEGAHGEG